MNLFPKLVVSDAKGAIAFYTEAFGAKEADRYEMDGKIAHVRLVVGDAQFTLKDEDSVDPAPGDRAAVILMLEVADPDAVGARMEAGGASVIFPIEDHPYGRMGRFRDPFGHVWIISRG
ncbi:VOC family protein [Actinomadura barringtoniae]|uniref:VOC family protein n=1 Tax=Actinomadura barringtoniae TaxID=1427535 RepID=A0A939PPI5_9ACTN|nr:VOC family protein [Actinomadura barringtoniae]MBO2452839.1 VOC family protein [Actinomadura barringtoniae]